MSPVHSIKGVRFVTAGADDDMLSNRLRALTKALADAGEEISGGALGGDYGYGARHFDCDLFMMHCYCWCERAECLWCMPWQSDAHRAKQIAEILVLYGEPAAGFHVGAPLFWHKPSGLQVWWYKWIGRDNEVRYPGGAEPWRLVDECIAWVEKRAAGGDAQGRTP